MVKTRFIPILGRQGASELYKHMAEDTHAIISSLDIPVFIYFSPKDKQGDIRQWLGSKETYVLQQGDNLGERMNAAFMQVFTQGFDQAVLIGSDLPDLPKKFITQAVMLLDDNDVVVGPTEDGGFYLIGWRKKSFDAQVFQGISWGTDKVYQQTMNHLHQLDQSVGQLPLWHDIDRFDDLRYLLTADENNSTKTWMEKHLKQEIYLSSYEEQL